jgi:hypothetical protein
MHAFDRPLKHDTKVIQSIDERSLEPVWSDMSRALHGR